MCAALAADLRPAGGGGKRRQVVAAEAVVGKAGVAAKFIPHFRVSCAQGGALGAANDRRNRQLFGNSSSTAATWSGRLFWGGSVERRGGLVTGGPTLVALQRVERRRPPESTR